ncbi:hypothetical protein FBU30_000221 [Linnemannia zychae]|nr:hypothetical protein FBU30_000221 [Linnemannia zychae]
MTTPKPDITAAAAPTATVALSTPGLDDFFKAPTINNVTPKDSSESSPIAETAAELDIKPEPRLEVATTPVLTSVVTNGQESPLTPKAETATVTPPTAPGAAVIATVASTDAEMTLAPRTPIEQTEEVTILEDFILDESDHEDFSDDDFKENGADSEETRLSNKIEELEKEKAMLMINLDEIRNEKEYFQNEFVRSYNASQDLHRQLVETQQQLQKKNRDYEVMSKNYLEHVRLIRATDDDHSTIKDRLTQLKAAIEHLVRKAQGSRSVNLNRDVVIDHFKASGLLENFPVSADKLEAYHLNLYMESVIMSTLVSRFFDKALNCIFNFNEGFKDIYDWMYSRNEKLAVRWRQQLCVMITQDKNTKIRQEEEVTATATALSELISKVYTNANELSKLTDLCNKAFELSIAMTALESVISPETVELGTPFDEESMGTSLKSNTEGKVALVIFPSFVDKERAFNIRPKVWCY